MMTDLLNPLVEMMRRIRFDIFERYERGTFNYEKDMATLRKHLDLALEVNNPTLIVATYNALGIMEQRMGHFAIAQEYLREAYAVAEAHLDYRLMGAIQTNRGEIYRLQYQFPEAVAAYTTAQKLSEKAQNTRTQIIAQNNIALCLLALEEYNAAEDAFEKVCDLTQADPWSHIDTLIETHNGLAEIYLRTNRSQLAWQVADHAERLATEREFLIFLADTHLTKAHIAETDPDRKEEATHYYRLAREGLRQHGTPILLARTLLEEAHYQHRRPNIDDSHRLATEAYEMLKQLNLHVEAEIAQKLQMSVGV